MAGRWIGNSVHSRLPDSKPDVGVKPLALPRRLPLRPKGRQPRRGHWDGPPPVQQTRRGRNGWSVSARLCSQVSR